MPCQPGDQRARAAGHVARARWCSFALGAESSRRILRRVLVVAGKMAWSTGTACLLSTAQILLVTDAGAQSVTVPQTPGAGVLRTMCVTGGATNSTLYLVKSAVRSTSG